MKRLLATFNVSLFLMLPFIFNKDHLNIRNTIKVFRRYYIPFFLFLSLTTLIYTLIYTHDFNIFQSFIVTLSIATEPMIKNLSGSSYLWFLPTLVSTLLLLMLYHSVNYKKLFLFIMLVIHISITLLDKETLYLFPLNSAIALYLFSLGVIISHLYNEYLDKLYTFRYIIFLLLIGLLYVYYGTSYWYAIIKLPNYTNIFDLLLFDFIQIFAFFTILFIAHNIKLKALSWIGHRSLIVYTVHPLIIFVLNYLYKWNGLLEGFIKLFIIIVVSAITAYSLNYIRLDKYIYPR